jgi:hypothetical protein
MARNMIFLGEQEVAKHTESALQIPVELDPGRSDSKT